MANRITAPLSQRALAGLSDSIANRPALCAAAAKFVSRIVEESVRRKRVVLLNLNKFNDLSFWQTLHNLPDKFEIISEKESHQRGEYLARVIFYELGEDLPVVKTQEQLIEEYNTNLKQDTTFDE